MALVYRPLQAHGDDKKSRCEKLAHAKLKTNMNRGKKPRKTIGKRDSIKSCL